MLVPKLGEAIVQFTMLVPKLGEAIVQFTMPVSELGEAVVQFTMLVSELREAFVHCTMVEFLKKERKNIVQSSNWTKKQALYNVQTPVLKKTDHCTFFLPSFFTKLGIVQCTSLKIARPNQLRTILAAELDTANEILNFHFKKNNSKFLFLQKYFYFRGSKFDI